jgi:L-2,4-diaminobutyric acid acetyltransferase
MESHNSIQLNKPRRGDGPAMRAIARDTGVLSVNSAYYYAMMARCFSDTCLVARSGEQVCGYIAALFLPAQPETLFVWQIGVSRAAQGKGIGKQMLIRLIERARPTFLEATIALDNQASLRAFQAAARQMAADATFSDKPFFTQSDMGSADAPEHLMRIGPIQLLKQNA